MPAISKGRVVSFGNNAEFETKSMVNPPFTMLEPPRENVEYYAVVDGVASGTKARNSGGSSVAMHIMAMFNPSGLSYAPVLTYLEEPKTVELSYINIVAAIRFYNKFGGFKGIAAESNAATGDHFTTFLEKEGLDRYILNRKDVSGKKHSNVNINFTYVTIDIRNFQIRQANLFLRKYAQNIKMLSLLESLLKGAADNADERDAWLMFFLAIPVDFDKKVE